MVVLFADERLLSSDPGSWDQFIREAHEAEAYSRKLSKRVGEGYAAKRRRLGVPGGNRAPFGIIREGKPSTLRVDEERAAIVVQAYLLAATGSTDWEVATQTGLAKTHVGELLTNPIYAGRLRTGEAAGIAPIVDPALWSTVQTMRERRRTRAPGRIVKRAYALRLSCAGCGKYLYGDIGRYRHPAPTCEGFLAARPDMRRRRRGCRDEHDRRIKGHSYPQAWYEDAIGALLGEVGSLDDLTITEAVRLYGEDPGRADELALARIERPAGGGLAAARQDARHRSLAGDDAAPRRGGRGGQDSHGTTEGWRRRRSSPTCARCPPCGPIQDQRDAGRWPRRCSPRSKWRGTRGWSTRSHRTPSSSGSAGRCPRSSRSVRRSVSLVGARGFEPPGPITRIIVPDYIADALRDVA